MVPRIFGKYNEGGRNYLDTIFIEVMMPITPPRERGELLG
jgi:hypothetical protein